MIELPLVLIGGLLGSAHCLGMCGPFTLLIGAAARSWPHNLARQLVYSLGRIFSYCVFGAAVGYGALRVSDRMGHWMNIQAGIAILAGLLLITQGAIATGGLTYLWRWGRTVLGQKQPDYQAPSAVSLGCLLGGMVGAFLRDRRWSHVFVAGVLTGLLPCGLVYAFVVLAASTGNPFAGAATMIAFGAGTVPMMVLAGTGAGLLSLAGRQKLLTIAAWCVILTGVISLARGVSFLQHDTSDPVAACPLCD